MRLRLLASPVLLVSLSLSACGGTTAPRVEAGSGPAASSSSSSSSADAGTAKFGEKFKYADGVEVEVTKIETAALNQYGYIGDKAGKKGTSYTKLSVRVRNGSGEALDAIGSTQMH